jgi:histidinol-phosphate aminotransferase
MAIAALARAEIRDLQVYQAAAVADDNVKMHANEAPAATGTGETDGLNRYPAPRPAALIGLMAGYYGVAEDNVLVTRGSSEGIDLLMRTFCSAGRDNVLLTPPAFEMYQVYASIQGTRAISVPLQADRGFAVNTDLLLGSCDANTKLIFLCSPNNPVGTVIPRAEIVRILETRTAKSVVVIDEAYIEYSDTDSLASLVTQYENLVVLRTLSKALALAGARCGAVIASTEILALLESVLAPYAMASPVITSAERALTGMQLREALESVNTITAERERLRVELGNCATIERVWPSQANFLFARFRDLAKVKRCLADAGITIRIYADNSELHNCARITIASATDNDRLLRALRSLD